MQNMSPNPDLDQPIENYQETGVLFENDYDHVDSEKVLQKEKLEPREYEILWSNVARYIICHTIGFYGLYLSVTTAQWATISYSLIVYQMTMFGVTAGVHRLWSHKSYKVTWPLKIILLICQMLSGQKSVIEWSRDHRVHHKYQETNADPHNVKRGFLFAHTGWVLVKSHKDFKARYNEADVSDLYADPLLRFQRKYHYYLMPIACWILPSIWPIILWKETWITSFCLNMSRYILTLHATFLINSAAHMWGNKPYDRFLCATDNLFVSLLISGEGWHNYHHTFPWDYRASEYGKINISRLFIDFFAKIGWAYDMKTVSDDVVKKRALRTGDGSIEIWGWGDKDQTVDNYKSAVILNQKNE